MFKRCKFIDPSKPSTSRENEPAVIDWKLCVFCQKSTGEKLQCPAKSTKKDAGIGYKTVADNIIKFDDINCLPSSIELDEGSGIKDTFLKHSARWHKVCKEQFNSTKLARAQKRKSTETLPSPVKPMKTRSTLCTELAGNQDDESEKLCFFCDKPQAPNETFHKASTTGLTSVVREAALELRDTKLLARLALPDMVALEAEYHLENLRGQYDTVYSWGCFSRTGCLYRRNQTSGVCAASVQAS